NSWSTKAAEMLPDGNQNIVYTNAFGEVMLKSFKQGTSEWKTFNKYDSAGAGRLILSASPSAVTGYDEPGGIDHQRQHDGHRFGADQRFGRRPGRIGHRHPSRRHDRGDQFVDPDHADERRHGHRIADLDVHRLARQPDHAVQLRRDHRQRQRLQFQ